MKANLGCLGVCAFVTCILIDSTSWGAPFRNERILVNPDGRQVGGVTAFDGSHVLVPRSDVGIDRITSSALFDVITGQKLRILTASDADEESQFTYGNSAAIEGNIALVGDFGNGFGSFGSVYVFDVTTGAQIRELIPSDPSIGKEFGRSMKISGNIAIIGATGDDGRGAAYLFELQTGTQLFKLTASDGASGDAFGFSVDISGNRAIVGAYGDDNPSESSGSAYIFDVNTGAQLKKLTANDAGGLDSFGYSVAIDGDNALVGARQDRDAGFRSGAAYLFDVNSGIQQFKLQSSDIERLDEFGSSVAIDGSLAVVGSPNESSSGNLVGAAYVFDVSSGAELVKLTPSNAVPLGRFGGSVSISGSTIVVGGYIYTPEPTSFALSLLASLSWVLKRPSQ